MWAVGAETGDGGVHEPWVLRGKHIITDAEPAVPRYAVRTARPRLIRVRCTYRGAPAALCRRYVHHARRLVRVARTLYIVRTVRMPRDALVNTAHHDEVCQVVALAPMVAGAGEWGCSCRRGRGGCSCRRGRGGLRALVSMRGLQARSQSDVPVVVLRTARRPRRRRRACGTCRPPTQAVPRPSIGTGAPRCRAAAAAAAPPPPRSTASLPAPPCE